MANMVRLIHAASLTALLLCGCGRETVSPVLSDLKSAKSPQKTSQKSPTATQAKVTLFVPGITQQLGLF